MPSVVRVTDVASAHGPFPATKVIMGSPDTFVNSLPVHRNGDTIASHTHARAASGGSPNVFVNGKAVVRVGDSVSCGGTLITGSPDTFVN